MRITCYRRRGVPDRAEERHPLRCAVRRRDALGLKAGDRVLFRVHDGRAVLAKIPSFLELAGSVPVPPGKRGPSWSRIRTETWRRRAGARR